MCTTEREAAQLHTFGATTTTTVLPLPVAELALPVRSQARAALGLRPRARLVLFCGRIDPKKGLPLLLEVFAASAGPDDVLVIAGSGDERLAARLVARARELPCGDRIRFPGWVDASGRAALLAAADVFVLLSDNENFSVATAEAVRAGVPALISDQVYLGDELSRHHAARVCRAERGAAVDALRRLLRDDAERARLSSAGRRWAAEALDPDAVGTQYRQLVRKVMSQCPQSVF
jgi:glycosyltransferase involved in cell wall biosynthesis